MRGYNPVKIQFREDEELLAYVQSKGLNPNEVAREAFEAEVRRMKADDKYDRLAKLGLRFSKDPTESVREDRER